MRRNGKRFNSSRKVLAGLRLAARIPIEPLEQRRLLSVVINGTSGNDSIIMQMSGNTTNVYVNSQLVESTTTETTYTLNGLDGNDSIDLQEVPQNARVTINGGNGNDTLRTVDTNFVSIGSGATIDVIGGAGTDTMAFNDTIDSSPPTYYIDNTGLGNYNGNKHVITVENDVETQSINFGPAADYLYVGSTENGMAVNMGDGNDTVNFGGGDSIIPSNLAPASFDGGAGTNEVILDDSADTIPNAAAIYNFTSTGALNQTLFGFTRLDLDVAKGNSTAAAINGLYFSGMPSSLTTINLNGSTSTSSLTNDIISVGMSNSPVDFDSMHAAFTFNLPISTFSIYDQDADNSNNPWILYTTTANSGTQFINKGSVTFAMPTSSKSVPTTMQIFAGSTDDTFEVAGFLSNPCELFGGAGNDNCIFVNYGTNQHGDDLDALMGGRHLFFEGDAGNDFLDADDSGGAVGSGSNSYTIQPSADFIDYIDDDGVESIWKNQLDQVVDFDAYTTERVNFVADDGNNPIYYGETGIPFNLTVNGGDGNDTIYQYAGFNPGPSTLIGGSGTDKVVFDESPLNYADTIGFSGSYYWAQSTSDSATLDSTIESCVLYTAKDGSSVTIASKPAALPLTVYGGVGPDQFFVGGGDLDSNGLSHLTISGGGGTDSLEFDDQNDAYSSSESEVYQLNGDELDKGTASFPYSGFESLTLMASTNGSNVQTFGSTVNVNTTDVPTTIYACITRSAIINVGDATAGDLVNINAPVTLVMGGVGGANINDQNSAGDKNYSFSSAGLTVSSGQTINFSGGPVTLNANNGNNNINVNVTSTLLTIKANGGNDTVNLGAGNLAANLAVIPSIDGGTGTNTLAFDDSIDPTFRSGTISSSTFVYDRSYSYQTNMQALRVYTGSGGSAITVNSMSIPLTLTGGSGNDSFVVGSGILDSALENNITATGGGGTNSILLDDHQQVTPRTYTIDNNGNFFEAAESNDVPDVTATGFNVYTISCNNGADTINVSGSVPVTILGNAGDDKLTTTGSSTHTPNVTFDGGSGNDIVNVNTNNVGSSIVKFTDSQTLSTLQIGTGGDAVAVAGSNLVIDTKALGIASTNSYLDLNDNDLIVDYSSTTVLPTIAGDITTARNGGAWNGAAGITSTSAKNNSKHITMLGAMEASDFEGITPANTTFDGVTLDNTAVLVKYTYYGDADFNGKVDGGDYARMDLTFGKEKTQGNIGGWLNGDFDGDGRVNGSDYGLADLAFGAQSGTLGRANPPVGFPTSSPGSLLGSSLTSSPGATQIGRSGILM